MKNNELIKLLKNRDPEGDVMIFVRYDGDVIAYHEVSKVDSFTSMPGTVLEAGDELPVG
jgi:hypothetical protein